MRIEDFLSNDSFTMVNKKLAKTLWIWQTIYLQELISQRKRFWQNEFFFTQNNMEEELWITAKTQWRYAKELQEKWLIVIKRKGVPAKNYFTIIDMAIINIIPNGKTRTDKMSELDETKCPNPYNNNWSNNKSNSETLPKNEDSRAGELDVCARVESYADIQDVIEDDSYRINNNKLLKCIIKMCDLWYVVNKKEKDIKKLVDWIKEKAEIYNIKNADWSIAQWTMLQIFDQWYEYWNARWNLTNHKTAVIRFMMNHNKPYKKK